MSKFYTDPKSGRANEHEQTVYYSPMPFCMVTRIDGVLCSDGKRRRASCTSHPDTFFSIPATVNVGKRTVSGFVWISDGLYSFTRNAEGKNADALPAWPSSER